MKLIAGTVTGPKRCGGCNRTMTLRVEEYGNPSARTWGMEEPWPEAVNGMFRLAGWAPEAEGARFWRCAGCRGE